MLELVLRFCHPFTHQVLNDKRRRVESYIIIYQFIKIILSQFRTSTAYEIIVIMSTRSWISTQPEETPGKPQKQKQQQQKEEQKEEQQQQEQQKEELQQSVKELEKSVDKPPTVLRKLTLEKFSGEKSGPVTDPRQSIRSDKRAKEGVVNWKASLEKIQFVREKPPPSPMEYSDAPAGSPLFTDMLPWLEMNDKHNYMSHCPPRELAGLINTKISTDGDRYIMRLQSNSSFLAHSWTKTTGIGCCNTKGVKREIIVSTGPQCRGDPQMIVMAIEKTPSAIIGITQKHGTERGIGLVVNMSKGVVLLASATSHVSTNQMNKYVSDLAANSSAPPPDNIIRLTTDSSAPDTSSAVNCCDDSLCFRDFKSKSCCLMVSERSIDFFNPINGHQAFAVWLAWKLAGRTPRGKEKKSK